ncbi:DNA polymerase [Candidatus Acidianus copahuensis]|uniref:DNA polymerase n=1 Tax=Candidatus Acidianus copahuensis TaxID=1160895 RepID=A0A031LP07_9CREN|nr:DNA polymerase [Candidatus Acidianus copahuensis]
MGRSYFLDKDIVIDRDNNVYLVYTNFNPPGYIFALKKYIFSGKGLWKGYERNLKQYGAINLAQSSQDFNEEPCYGASFPILLKSRILIHLKPEEFARELLKRSPRDGIEEKIIQIYGDLGILNFGVTGSVLIGIQHKDSDIDIVIYGSKSAEEFISNFEGYEPDTSWPIQASKDYSIPIDMAKKIYDKRTRGIFRGIKYSFLFVDEKPRKYCEKVCTPLGEFRDTGDLEGDVNALFYPSIASFTSTNIEAKIVSYEGIYNIIMYGKRKVKVKGVLMKCDEEYSILVGDKKIGGYILPL